MKKALAAAALLAVLAFAGGASGDGPSPSSRPARRPSRARTRPTLPARSTPPSLSPCRRSSRPSAPTTSSSPSGTAREKPTACRGRCSPRSTRSSPTSGATWARARPARSGGCSSCRPRGFAGASTRTATGSPIPGIPTTPSSPRPATSPPPGAHDDISRAVFAYNHAQWYVDEVLGLAADFGSGGAIDFTGSQAVFRLDDLQQQIAKARRAVARAREADPADRAAGRRVHRPPAPPRAQGRRPEDLDREFRELESRIARLERGQAADRRRIEAPPGGCRRGHRPAPVAEERARRRLRRRSRPPPRSAAPWSSGDYVFPVGGGPDVVSVAHTHHDYPGRRHRGAGGLAALRARRLGRPRRVHRRRRAAAASASRQARERRRVRLLPPLLPRADASSRVPRSPPAPRSGSSADRPRDGPAPAPPVLPAGFLSAGRAVVPVVRGRRLQLAGRADPHAPGGRAQESAPFHGRRDHSRALWNAASWALPVRGLTFRQASADGGGMAARLTALLPRLVALTVIWLLGAATYTLAADTVPIAKHDRQAAGGLEAARAHGPGRAQEGLRLRQGDPSGRRFRLARGGRRQGLRGQHGHRAAARRRARR